MARSECEHCGYTLRGRDLIPLLSYAALKGRCRACRTPISTFHPAVEMAALGLALWAWLTSVPSALPTLWANCVLGWWLLALACIDWRHDRLPVVLVLILLLAGLGATALLEPWQLTGHVLGAAAGYAGLRLVQEILRFTRLHVSLAGGDAKFLAACGAWVGWDKLPGVVLLAAILAFALTAFRSVGIRKTPLGEMSVPFGTCLAFGTWIVRLHAG